MRRYLWEDTNDFKVKVNSSVKRVQDWPKPGVNFIDLSPITSSPHSMDMFCEIAASVLHDATKGPSRDVLLVSVETRGIVFGTALSRKMHSDMILCRKEGKLPPSASDSILKISTQSEYGSQKFELDASVIQSSKYSHIVVVDDVFATGNTILTIHDAIDSYIDSNIIRNIAGSKLDVTSFAVVNALSCPKNIPLRASHNTNIITLVDIW